MAPCIDLIVHEFELALTHDHSDTMTNPDFDLTCSELDATRNEPDPTEYEFEVTTSEFDLEMV
jgi:hypothetical protein